MIKLRAVVVGAGIGPARIASVTIHRMSNIVPGSFQNGPLTETETEVLQWLADGKRHEDIGVLMTKSIPSVHQHVRRIQNKLGANTAAGAVAIGIRKGYIK